MIGQTISHYRVIEKQHSIILSGGIVCEANDAAVEGPPGANPVVKRQGILTTYLSLNLARMPFHFVVAQSSAGPSTPQVLRFAENLLRSG